MAHSFSRLVVHFIFSTKDRQPLISAPLQQRLYPYIGGILHRQRSRLLKAGGTSDHIHLLAALHPELGVAEAMRLVKANSSKWVHDTFPNLSAFAWQTGYGAFTVSESSIGDVIRYVDNQEEHHRRVTFEEEFVGFLRRHGIEFDERYLWT